MAKEKLVTENPFKVLLNGKLVARIEAVVSIDSVAFKYAAMVFEGIRGHWNERERQLFVYRVARRSCGRLALSELGVKVSLCVRHRLRGAARTFHRSSRDRWG